MTFSIRTETSLEINVTWLPSLHVLLPISLSLPPSPFPNALYASMLEGCEMNRHERSRSSGGYAAWRRRMFAELVLTTEEAE